MSDAAITISKRQRDLHVTAELLGLLIAGPALLIVSRNPQLSTGVRRLLLAIGLGTLIADGYFVSRYLRKDQSA